MPVTEIAKQPTMHLRIVRLPFAAFITGGDVLQQEWKWIESGEMKTEWRNVDIVSCDLNGVVIEKKETT
jgi:hypothetical protein